MEALLIMTAEALSPKEILLVEDEEDIAELIRFHLERDGYAITWCESGEDGLKTAGQEPFDLALLDLMLPGLNGLEVCKRLRSHKQTENLPIIMVSARGEEADIVAGLELGADDYVTKPFSPRVLLARVRAVLRRRSSAVPSEDDAVSQGAIEIHPGRHEVRIEGDPVQLTATEFRILHLLARRPGWVFTRSQIVDEIRGTNHAVTDRSVDVQIVSLRRKLGEHGSAIETVRGVGYRFREA